ncbi:MAG: glycine zipper family protein [Gemmatimonadota bacterium]|nr:glycine zipper family protein [Gemmatimonadota bacterium]MDH5197434.1 glycine zipper family protein [Gemmatimonadota bacterium]
MSLQRFLSLALAASLSLTCAPGARAERDGDRDDLRKRGAQQREEVRPQTREVQRAPERDRRSEPARAAPPRPGVPDAARLRPAPAKAPSGYVLDRRHDHNRYYPPAGYEVSVLPTRYRTVVYRDVSYYFYDGIWYRPLGPRFVVVLPPIGVVVPVLPSFYTIIWVGAIPYYYAAGVYYTWYPEYRGYVVTEPPPAQAVQEAESEQLFVYPKRGQSEEQQATDRYECHRWASQQTGFDPTQPGGSVPEDKYAQSRSDYLRAMKACLEARDYSVQ